MEKRRRRKPRLQRSFDDLEGRQQNIPLPNYVAHAWSVDEAFFSGSADAPLVQRIGAWRVGSILLAAGIACVPLIRDSTLAIVPAITAIAAGGYIFSNGCGRRKKSHQD